MKFNTLISFIFTGEGLPRTWETVKVPADVPQKYRLAGLKPKTNYAVRLQAIGDRGPGVLSDPIRLTTLPLGYSGKKFLHNLSSLLKFKIN